MKNLFALSAALACLLFVAPASAEVKPQSGTILYGVAPDGTITSVKVDASGQLLPGGGFTALGYQQITSLSASTALTVPTGSTFVLIVPETQAVRWRPDGSTTAPTATVGQPLAVGQPLLAFCGPQPALAQTTGGGMQMGAPPPASTTCSSHQYVKAVAGSQPATCAQPATTDMSDMAATTACTVTLIGTTAAGSNTYSASQYCYFTRSGSEAFVHYRVTTTAVSGMTGNLGLNFAGVPTSGNTVDYPGTCNYAEIDGLTLDSGYTWVAGRMIYNGT